MVPTNLNEGCPSETTFKYQRNKTEYMEFDEQKSDRSFRGTIDWTDGQPTVTVTGSSWW